jgi:HTH-type transcriptional regulator/antitoxin HigA
VEGMNTARIDKSYMDLVRKFPLIPLREKSEFEEAVKVMKNLAYRRSSLSSGEADYLTVLGDLIAQYEKRLPRLAEEMTPRDSLSFLMESNRLTQTDLVEFVGHKSNLSAFLNGHRGLSKRAATRLAEYFKVSPAVFLPRE